MSTSAIVMMILGCGIVWGGTVIAIVVAINGSTNKIGATHVASDKLK